VLLPRGVLPLNIFEPRYLSMVDDSMRSARLIGMVQPTIHESHTAAPPIYPMGTVGRITSYSETEDSRYLISLTGVCRFRIREELAVMTPYRQCVVSYDAFRDDLREPTAREADEERAELLSVLKGYLSIQRLKADWESITHAPTESLVNALAMICPFEAKEKQALLEAPTLSERARVLIALIEMANAEPSTGSSMPLQ
jgi:Lon protease-like protein